MPRVLVEKFFQEQSAHSRVKSDIVFKFVIAWAKVFLASKKYGPLATQAAYVDVFSGPGTYEDGKPSTPLHIMRAAIASKPIREGLRTFFNDVDSALVQSLEQEIKALSGYESLRYKPEFRNEPASTTLLDSLQLPSDIPYFYFLDQFGWADVKPTLIKRIFSARRCDCAFFLRTSRVVAAVSNLKAEPTMIELLGKERLLALRSQFAEPFGSKEDALLGALKDVMREAGAPHFQAFPFRIKQAGSSKQHLIYLGKHELGLSIMKEIMSKSSSSDEAGVPVIGFSEVQTTRSLFEEDPIVSLMGQLIRKFSGKRMRVGDIFSGHHPTNDRFLLKHYQEAIRRLEVEGIVLCSPPLSSRPKRNEVVTVSENVIVEFNAGGHFK